MKVGIIGIGNIGSEVYKRVQRLGWKVTFILRDDGVYKNPDEKIDILDNFKKYTGGVDLVFLAIPTLDDGKIAADYITFFMEKDIFIVTCEKGALSNYFSELEQWKNKIGYSATVGGGTQILRYLEGRIGPETQEIHAVINGTLNYIFDEIARGRNLSEVISEAQKLGYAEPGSETYLDVINKEATQDAPMKTAVLFNICSIGGKQVRAKNFKIKKVDESQLKQLVRESKKRRYIVSITRGDNNNEDIIGGFSSTIDGWMVSAGFKNLNANRLFGELIPSGVNNAVIVYEGVYGADGTYRLSGQGAGAGPTASAMMKDAVRLTGSSK